MDANRQPRNASASQADGLRIGQLAQRLGTTTKTLRFYEQIGLLDSTGRTAAGYRIYQESAIVRARLVLGLRRLGLSVQELQSVLDPADDGRSLRQRLLGLMDEKLRDVDIDLSVLQGRRDDLAARHQALLSVPRSKPGTCICDALLVPCTCTTGDRAVDRA